MPPIAAKQVLTEDGHCLEDCIHTQDEIAAWKLDDWATPDDNTDLNASESAHGLLMKLGGGTTNFLRADGTWAAPPGGGGGVALDDLTDVAITSVADNEVLAYDSSSSRWINQSALEAGLAALSGATFTGSVVVSNGSLAVGVTDSVAGTLTAYGDSNTVGGKLYLSNGANDDSITDAWFAQACGAALKINCTGVSGARLELASDGGLTILGGLTEGLRAYAYLYRETYLDLPSANTWTAVPLTSEGAKVGVTHSTSSNAERFTVTNAGKYLISWEATCRSIVPTDKSGYCTRLYSITGSAEIAGSFRSMRVAGGDLTSLCVGSIIVALDAGTTVAFQAGVTNGGADLNYYDDGNQPDPTTWVVAALSIVRVGP